MNTIVIGDGWAAISAVGFLVQAQKPVIWVAGTGVRMFSALPSMESGPALELWQRLARAYGIETGEELTGSFLREYRNKAFREPTWSKAPTPEARAEVMKESLWAPELRLAPLWEARFEPSFNEIESALRAFLTGDDEEGIPYRELIRRVEGIPVQSFKTEGDRVVAVVLGSGEELACERVIYADRWDALPKIQGLPKNLPFIRRRDPASVLQAQFKHSAPMGAGLKEGFYGSLHKEAGEEMERHAWGHFSADGAQSYWTLCLTSDEIEDNHVIAKKLRRLKNALDKMFTGESWLPQGKADFMATVQSEAVRFHESVVFGEGDAPTEPVTVSSLEGAQFITDGYGPARAITLVAQALGLPEAVVAAPGLEQGEPESKDAELDGTAAS